MLRDLIDSDKKWAYKFSIEIDWFIWAKIYNVIHNNETLNVERLERRKFLKLKGNQFVIVSLLIYRKD